jgi:hypothetical protein
MCQGNIRMGYFEEDRKSQSVLCRNSGIGAVVLRVLILVLLLLFFITVIYCNDKLYMESICVVPYHV